MKVCIIDGCEGEAGKPGTARGWCSKHYSRWQRTGDPLTSLTDLKPKASPICSVEGCEKPRWARGLCSMHLMRVRTYGSTGDAAPMTKRVEGECRIDGCRKPARYGIHQMCQGHYLRMLRHGDPLAGGRTPVVGAVCSIEGCARRHYAKDMCRVHYGVVQKRKRNAKMRAAEGHCTREQLAARVAYYGGRCHVCRGAADEIDHVKPVMAGGSNWPANLRPICRRCNRSKGATWRDVYGHHTPIVPSNAKAVA